MKNIMSDQDKIWDYFQNEGIDSFAQSHERQKFLVKHLESGMRVLNIGIGNGVLERLAHAKSVDIHCLDPSELAIENLRSSLCIGQKAQVGYSQTMPFKNQEFHVVIMSEVLEHLSDDVMEQTIKECHRVLCRGGTFIGTVPADEKLSENNVVCPDCGKIFHRWGHVQEFSENRLRGYLERQFSQCILSRRYFGSWSSMNWKGKIGFMLKRLTISIGIKGGGESFFFIARKNQ